MICLYVQIKLEVNDFNFEYVYIEKYAYTSPSSFLLAHKMITVRAQKEHRSQIYFYRFVI